MSGFFVVQESCRGSQENHGNSQRLLGPPERTERRSGSQLHLAWVEDEAEEISLPIPDTMAQQLETDPWYSAEEKEEGQEMFEDAREGLGEDQDMEWLRDLIANLSPSILRSLQDVSQVWHFQSRSQFPPCKPPGRFLPQSPLHPEGYRGIERSRGCSGKGLWPPPGHGRWVWGFFPEAGRDPRDMEAEPGFAAVPRKLWQMIPGEGASGPEPLTPLPTVLETLWVSLVPVLVLAPPLRGLKGQWAKSSSCS
ncbi:uncharacterized protein [Heliangelus exortis]|uniref:uncharacterized protein n=1 Tax=Heliangelus exortis TaxID=472823 RepID=UPI003A92E605